jgi:hypothetical protein
VHRPDVTIIVENTQTIDPAKKGDTQDVVILPIDILDMEDTKMAAIIQLKIRVDMENLIHLRDIVLPLTRDIVLPLTIDVILPLLTVDILDIEVTKLHKKLMENF